VELSLLLTAAAIMIPKSSLEALKQSINGQIMVSITAVAIVDCVRHKNCKQMIFYCTSVFLFGPINHSTSLQRSITDLDRGY